PPPTSTNSSQPETSGGPTTAPASAPPTADSNNRVTERADELADWPAIPQRAMRAYATATATSRKQRPQCELTWSTLAAVGKIASDHGRHGRRELDGQGGLSEPIGTITVRNFSGEVISRPGAAGPLQLGRNVWQRWASSASSETRPSIQDIDDAALTAGYALCGGNRDLSTGEDWIAGLSSLNNAKRYIHRVVATADVYGTVAQRQDPPDPQALRAVDFAISKIGLPYVWGGDGNKAGDAGFDCSGLTKAAYAVADVGIPRTAHSQYTAAPAIPKQGEPKLGDLIFYGSPAHIHHVGIYIGYGQMVDAPTFGQAVQVHPYRTPGDDFVRVGRPVSHQ